MKKNKGLNSYISIYKAQLKQGDIQIAYSRLLKFVMALKTCFSKTLGTQYSFGNISPGYLDFTYFSFFNATLRDRKLRFGIVLNHQETHFELWLMGQNALVQSHYWDLLKNTKWNKEQASMPKYSVLEVVLIEEPDFDDLDFLAAEIVRTSISVIEEIQNFILSTEQN